MATINIAGDTFEIPDEAAQAMKESVARFPQFKGNVAAWVAEWVMGTLLSLATQDKAQAEQDEHVRIRLMFAAKPKDAPKA